MSPLPYMAFYIADYLADTAHLTTQEHGAYILLIMNYFQRGKPLPADDARLARISRLSIAEWAEIRATIAEFFVEKDGVWYHKRIALELQKVAEKSLKARAAGKASAASRMDVVQRSFNECSATVQRASDNTDTNTDTDIKRKDVGRTEVSSSPSLELDCEAHDVVREAFDTYNTVAVEMQLPIAQQLTQERRKKIGARLQDCGGLAGWTHAVAKIRGSPFLCGQNDRGWKASLDFILKKETFTRLMEGSYDATGRVSAGQPRSTHSEVRAFIDAVADEAIERTDREGENGH